MIIADTNIIIDFWNEPTKQIEDIFLNEDIVLCGVVKTELLRGAKTENDFIEMNQILSEFPCFEFCEEDWIEVAKLCYKLKIKGIQVPLADSIIAHLAIKNEAQVWTNDNHFLLMKNVLNKLRLFKIK